MNKIIHYFILYFLCNVAYSQVYLPVSGDEVVLRLNKNSTITAIQKLNKELVNNQKNKKRLLLSLNNAVSFGKKKSEPRFIGLALTYIDRYLQTHPDDTQFMLLKADILQYDHKFDQAILLLNKIITLRSGFESARLMRANILQLQAHYQDALKDCYSLLGNSDPIVMMSCIAQIKGLIDEPKYVFKALSNLLKRDKNNPDPTLIWSYDILAQLCLQFGDKESAYVYYEYALSIAENNSLILTSYADLLIADSKFKQVQIILNKKKSNFSLLVRLAIAENKMQSASTSYREELKSRIMIMHSMSDDTHAREIALYYLYIQQQADKALHYASRNWSAQKELIDARLLLESAIAANKKHAARPVIEWYEKNTIKDIRLEPLISQMKGEVI